MSLDSYYGVPNLDVFYTSDVDEAETFLNEWSEELDFGLYIRVVPSENKAFFPVRVVGLGICRGTRVLYFDLRPFLREVPSSLPRALAQFLEREGRLFLGMDLKRSAGRLAFEWDTVVSCVDYNIRAWPQLKLGGGLYGVFNRFVSDIDLWRPESLESPSAQGRHTYLQWAVAHFFTMFYGAAAEDWIITRSELFEAGPVYLRVAKPQHDWASARREWMQRRRAKAASSILNALQVWRDAQRERASELSEERGASESTPAASE